MAWWWNTTLHENTKSTTQNRINMYLCCTYAGQIQLPSCQTSKLVPPQTWTIRLTASIPRPQDSKYYTSPLSLNNKRAVQCEAKKNLAVNYETRTPIWFHECVIMVRYY
jgi:hypothetical protein